MSIDPEDVDDGLERAWTGRPAACSKALWKLRRAVKIRSCNTSRETILEKSVAMLAQRGHMPDYFNQCPAASGIFGSSSCKQANVDLVRWSEAKEYTDLIELKWESGDPHAALSQIVRYGVLYLFCRLHRSRLPLRDRLGGDGSLYALVDAAQLVKHAFALRTEVHRPGRERLAPVLFYLYAQPDAWPESGRRIEGEDKARHRREIHRFAGEVAGDEVAFVACSYGELLDRWARHEGIAAHASALRSRFSP